MSRQLGVGKGEKLFSDLRYVIMETLDRCQQLQWSGNQYEPDGLYFQFARSLRDLNEQRQKHTGQAYGVFENDVIITFNYDVMLDYAMKFQSMDVHYCLDAKPQPGPFLVLKLHGSANWASCRSCGSQPQVVPPSPIQVYPPLTGETIDFKMVTEVLPKMPCTSCKKIDTLEPIIIPPTWSKAVGGTPIARVWSSAVKEIQNAFQIVVIGYSMPSTDTFFQYLLTLGLASNPNLHRVVVVNREDDSEAFRERYKGVFAEA